MHTATLTHQGLSRKQRMNVYLPFMTFLNPTDNQMTESKAQGFEYNAFGWVRWS